METLRMLKARKMIEQGVSAHKYIPGNCYHVESQSRPGTYHSVRNIGNKWSCDCKDHKYNGVLCKHIWTIILIKEKEAKKTQTIEPINKIECPQCHSIEIKKDGMRHNKYGNLQRYECLDCGKRFSINVGFERMKHNPRFITVALQLYFSGESLRNTKSH
jgi:ssDNA-binding Zn-finger/Zn-ribbon topoisomerase 1